MTVCKGFIPTRAFVASQLFLACFISYMLRVNMSLNIIAMVQSSNDGDSNITRTSECVASIEVDEGDNISAAAFYTLPDYGPRYDWDKSLQGTILSSYFWGYMITCIPGGFLAERFGATKVVLVSTLLSGALSLFTPLAASWHYSVVILDRFLLGLVGGVMYPCLHFLISRWAPPDEKGKFVSSLLGSTLGTVVTWPMVGAIIDSFGWMWAFFIPGGIALLWCLLWWYIVTDNPETHRWISEEEKFYIMKSTSGSISKKKRVPPYKDIFSSVPFWALAVLHLGNMWGVSLLLTSGPMFMSEALGFNIKSSGGLASLPYLARLIFGLVFGSVGDYLRRKDVMPITIMRKFFVTFSHFIPALLLYGLNFTGCSAVAAVSLVTFSLGINGASTLTNLQNAQDLAPNFAATIYGIVNCIGGIANFMAPIMTSYFTKDNTGLRKWHYVFSTGATIYLGCGVVFLIFGTGQQQQYNNVDEQEGAEGVDNPAFEPTGTKADQGVNTNTKV